MSQKEETKDDINEIEENEWVDNIPDDINHYQETQSDKHM